MTSVAPPSDRPGEAPDRVSLSNRGETVQKLYSGVDTIGLSFPVTDVDLSVSEGSPVREQRVRDLDPEGREVTVTRWSRSLPGGGFMAWGVSDRVWIEASAPKRLDPDAIDPLAAAEAVAAAEDLVLEVCSRWVKPLSAEDARRPRINRLDGVRDFAGCANAGQLLSGLAAVRRDKRHAVRVWQDGSRSGAWTLKTGPKAWEAYCYDKHTESGGRAPQGRMRFETRGRRDLLTSVWAEEQGAMIMSLDEVTEGSVEKLTRGMFERARFDEQVAGLPQVTAAIMAHEGLSGPEQTACLGYALQRASGIASPLHRHTQRKYDRVLRDLGITPEGTDLSGSYTARLDYDRGQLVTEAAG